VILKRILNKLRLKIWIWRGHAGTMLQAGRSRVQVPMRWIF
jgi:hypothetical protein